MDIFLGTFPIPRASSTTLGGIKVGERLSIVDGVLSADKQELILNIDGGTPFTVVALDGLIDGGAP